LLKDSFKTGGFIFYKLLEFDIFDDYMLGKWIRRYASMQCNEWLFNEWFVQCCSIVFIKN